MVYRDECSFFFRNKSKSRWLTVDISVHPVGFDCSIFAEDDVGSFDLWSLKTDRWSRRTIDAVGWRRGGRTHEKNSTSRSRLRTDRRSTPNRFGETRGSVETRWREWKVLFLEISSDRPFVNNIKITQPPVWGRSLFPRSFLSANI